ncbi:hypothetical protein [Microvirga sp. 2TAF3]|uniref:hypothetical protein n=1 Tax=Microvirga sp. 2TAF3 TaxID=3233014 RepID=UPI003F95A437
MSFDIDPWIAIGVVLATATTDAAYVFFNAAVVAKHRVRAANWSGIWYLLSAFAVISYTEHAIYVVFAALGSWIGAFLSVTWLVRSPWTRN